MNYHSSHSFTGIPSDAECRSGRVFASLLVLILVALGFPDMAPQGLQGILWTGAGLLMMVLPPEHKLPRAWLALGLGFVGLSALGFLPREWFSINPWRTEVEALGLDTGSRVFVEPLLAAESLAGFAVTAAVVLFLLGHRTDASRQHWLMLAFALGGGVWTVAALVAHKPGETFGFFVNRNHTATLLAMASFAGLGAFAQAVRWKAPWKIVLSLPPTCLLLWALFGVSESRAGLVLAVLGFAIWILLNGKRSFRGHAGKALLLLLIAAVGAFLIVDSTAKRRLTETVEKFNPAVPEMSGDPAAGPGTPESPFASEHEAIQAEPQMDARLTIFRATLGMIGQEPWTGVGPGSFARVFTQYRETADAPNDSQFLHPESDWLMMLSETGWPATLCLLAGVMAAFFMAIRKARSGRSRFLKTAGIVVALLLCIHGIFDVPGHRIGLAWAAALMLAMSLRSNGDHMAELRRPGRAAWRVLGLAVFACGVVLLAAQWTRTPLLPSVKVRHHMQIARDLYEQDQAAYDKATAEGRDYDPPPEQDPLETALREVAQASRIAPLDPYIHHVHGSFALHYDYDDKLAIARRAFTIQRRLDPVRVNVPMDQARAWKEQDPQESLALWKEALARARKQQARFPHGQEWVVYTYGRAMANAWKNESLSGLLLELAGGDSALVAQWANIAPAALLDREMPRLLGSFPDASIRGPFFQTWQRRGTKGAAQAFAVAHPELGLVAP